MSVAVLTIGVITPHAAVGPEGEWPLMVGDRIITRTARVSRPGRTVGEPGDPPTSPSGLRALATPEALDEAAAITQGSTDAIGYASTSTGYVIGHRPEAALVDRLSRRCNVPAASTSSAAAAALRTFDINRLALVHPPWFGDELNALGAASFRDQGSDVTSSQLADLPHDPRRIEPDAVITWISDSLTDRPEALFVGGNGFRSVSAIARLEMQIGRPVVTSNQALLWSLLQRSHLRIEVTGYGSLFR